MMEEPREQQQPAPASASLPQQLPPQPAYQQSGVAHPQGGPYAAAPEQPSAIETGGRLVRLLARRGLWAAGQGWRLVEPRLGWVILTGFLVGLIGVLSMMLVVPLVVRGRAAPGDGRVAALPPAPAVEDFLRGQQTYDADLMWDSFSPELRESLEGRDITRDTLAERVESERLAGHRYSGFKYIGGVKLDNRQTMYFYAVEIASPDQAGTVSFVFTVGGDGKIVSVD